MIVTMRVMSNTHILVSDGVRVDIQGIDLTIPKATAPVYREAFTRICVDGPIISIACGMHHGMIVARRGLYGYGMNNYMQLGICDWDGFFDDITFIRDDILAVACGRWHTLALAKNGELYGWGSNSQGQLNDMCGQPLGFIKIGFATRIAALGEASCIYEDASVANMAVRGTWTIRGCACVTMLPAADDPNDARSLMARMMTQRKERENIASAARIYGRIMAAVYYADRFVIATRNGIFTVADV
jgi:hypothetical protein